MDPSEMTVQQLRQLQAERFKAAGDDGTLRLLRLVAAELGAQLRAKYGPKYQWVSGDIEIYRDDYGGYTSVHQAGRMVCCTHPNTQLFVPGDWVEEIKLFAAEALQSQEAKAAERNERDRQELLEKLDLVRKPAAALPDDDVLEQ